MNNYQLYRTNVALGGQLKWDILVDNGSSGLYVSDFHVTPISRRVPYNYQVKDNALKYSHLENIKTLYKKIEGSFYQPCSDPLLVGEQPYLYKPTKGHENIDLHDNTFDMGIQRAQYSVYGKEFEALVPVWLEDVYVRDDSGKIIGVKPLKFQICMLYKTNVVPSDGLAYDDYVYTASKTLTFDFTDITSKDTHSLFEKYLYDYLTAINLDDSVIKVDFDKTTGLITGVDASTGMVKTIDVDSLVKDMVSQERLMMDFDSMIIDRFATNHMIAKQLFNFNLVFNVEELFPQQIMDMLRGKEIMLDIRVFVGDKMLDIKDFYTNYDHIQKERATGIEFTNERDQDINVFEELMDHTDVDTITKNRMTQTICHWSLAENNDYIFNLYDGMAGYVYSKSSDDELEAFGLSKVNQTCPDIWSVVYDASLNNISWINVDSTINNWQDYIELGLNPHKWAERASFFGDDSTGALSWVNMNKYDKDKVEALINPESELPIYRIIFTPIGDRNGGDAIADICWSKICNEASGDGMRLVDLGGKYMVFKYISVDNLLVVMIRKSDDIALNSLTFAGFRSMLQTHLSDGPWYFKVLLDMMDSVSQPKVVLLDKSLGYMRADGPINIISKDDEGNIIPETSEVHHYTTKNRKRLFRLDGYIKPTFVSPEKNLMFTKKVFTDDSDLQNSVFAKYASSGYPRRYKSIGYYPFESKSINMVDPRGDEYGRIIESHWDDAPYEYKWFTLSKLLVVDDELTFKLESDGSVPIKELILSYLAQYFDIPEGDSKVYYIYDLYNMKYDWEYKSLTEIDKYVYTINLVLR